MTKRFVYIFFAVMLVTAACGGSDASTDDTQAAPTTAPAATDTDDAPETATETTAAPSGESSTAGASGNATLKLDNGESYEFSILCSLEPQMAAGQEILFTVVSYDEPYSLDVSQWGEDSVMKGGADISVYDTATYDSIWDSSTRFGHELTLSLSGRTVTGSGMFVAEGDAFGDQVHGELEANC